MGRRGSYETMCCISAVILINTQEDEHLTRMTLMDRTDKSRVVSQEMGSFGKQQVSEQTVRRHLQQHGL